MLVFSVCPNNDGDIDGLQGHYLNVQIAMVTSTVYENATYLCRFIVNKHAHELVSL
jgi:hypothetical protein